MSTSEPEATRYTVCAWSKSTQEWITAEACVIEDTMQNWVSHRFIEQLIEKVPSAKFQDVGKVRQRIPPEVTFTWYKKDKNPIEQKDKMFHVLSRTADFPCDLGIRKSFLCPSNPVPVDHVLAQAVPEIKDSGDIGEETVNEPKKGEERENQPENGDQKKAKKWFKKLLAIKNGHDIKVNIFEDGEGDPPLDKATAADEWFRELEKYIRPHLRIEKLPKGHIPPKIAILDTGVDLEHSSIMACCENFLGIKSFTDSDPQDYHGHGTFTASLILKVVPQVHLYVAKVAERRLLPFKHNIADAIHWAIEKKVDIITISFGLENYDEEIEDAIREAYHQNIIIFAAASNSGGNHELTYPARNGEVIAIYATDGKGNKSDFNPTPRKRDHNFSILGEAIKSSWTTYRNPDTKQHTKRKSGTSYATPIAAGLAALILDFAKQNEVHWYKKLHTRQGMSNVFEAMAREERDKYDYVCPWKDIFEKGASSKSILETIAKRASKY